MDRADIVHESFLAKVAARNLPAGEPPSGPMADHQAVQVFRSGVECRALDRQSRKMQAAGQGYYTIGSSGHEGMAAVAAALRPTDMAFLHYRDGAFQIAARANQVPDHRRSADAAGHAAVLCLLRGPDPISAGGTRCWGPRRCDPAADLDHRQPPAQGVGAAYAIGAARRARPEHARCPTMHRLSAASAMPRPTIPPRRGPSIPQGGPSVSIGAAAFAFRCEDNGIGISTRTPDGWIEASFSRPPRAEVFCL
jgi:2-oxoisovalerate dehydrogenase E1 component